MKEEFNFNAFLFLIVLLSQFYFYFLLTDEIIPEAITKALNEELICTNQ